MRFRRFLSGLVILAVLVANNLPLAMAADSAPASPAPDATKNAPAPAKTAPAPATKVVSKPIRPNLVEKYLFEGKLSEGEKAITAQLQRTKKND